MGKMCFPPGHGAHGADFLCRESGSPDFLRRPLELMLIHATCVCVCVRVVFVGQHVGCVFCLK